MSTSWERNFDRDTYVLVKPTDWLNQKVNALCLRGRTLLNVLETGKAPEVTRELVTSMDRQAGSISNYIGQGRFMRSQMQQRDMVQSGLLAQSLGAIGLLGNGVQGLLNGFSPR